MKLAALCAVLILGFVAGCARPHPAQTAKTQPPARTEQPKSFYLQPLFSPGAQFATLPPPVQNTVRAEAGTAEIYNVVKDTSTGQAVYTVYFRNHEIFPPLYIASDGSVLHPDLTLAVAAPETSRAGLKLTELPPDVLKVLHDRAPASVIANINKEIWGDRVVYIVGFKDQTDHPKLYVATDGTVFSESPK